ncbi:MAG: hypothetical protein AAB383_04950 [Patescibacteria group bacterium]
MNKKLDLIVIIAITFLISIAAIVAFNMEFGPTKIAAQLSRLVLLVIFSYFLYQEKQWARWIFVVISLLAGAASSLAVLSLVGLGGPDFGVAMLTIGTMALFYLSAGIYLGFIRKWKKPQTVIQR